jgi:hypothetical protein
MGKTPDAPRPTRLRRPATPAHGDAHAPSRLRGRRSCHCRSNLQPYNPVDASRPRQGHVTEAPEIPHVPARIHGLPPFPIVPVLSPDAVVDARLPRPISKGEAQGLCTTLSDSGRVEHAQGGSGTVARLRSAVARFSGPVRAGPIRPLGPPVPPWTSWVPEPPRSFFLSLPRRSRPREHAEARLESGQGVFGSRRSSQDGTAAAEGRASGQRAVVRPLATTRPAADPAARWRPGPHRTPGHGPRRVVRFGPPDVRRPGGRAIEGSPGNTVRIPASIRAPPRPGHEPPRD